MSKAFKLVKTNSALDFLKNNTSLATFLIKSKASCFNDYKQNSAKPEIIYRNLDKVSCHSSTPTMAEKDPSGPDVGEFICKL